ncbi:carbohydrate ABC transporter permease [Occultella aeris]|uniref:L-arabinose transport system permease protein AraQ n=1 Tax=Occultella aeris TaxID=2761496 RepID=A0A7M4DDR0_9MICO|nr:carbohydrate ABC transporter permease [Occultella aeris]VZO34980.1 L-arabinose transport system permease protein AraQ [Occultella aeris]
MSATITTASSADPSRTEDSMPKLFHGRRSPGRWRPQLWHLFLIPFCALWVYPFIWMFSAAFKSQREMLLGGLGLIPQEPTLENFARAWTTAKFGEYTVNTIVFTVLVVGIVLLVTSLAGYALSRPGLPLKKLIIGVLVATMFIPHGYTIIPVFLLVNELGLGNSLLGAALAQAAPVHVVPVLLFMGFFAGMPSELEDAAKVDGAGFFRTFLSIMLPLAKPVIGTVALMNFISAWSAFFVPLVFTLGNPGLRTLGVGMYNFFGQESTDFAGLAAGATISVLPTIVVFLLLQKTFIEGIAGAVKS